MTTLEDWQIFLDGRVAEALSVFQEKYRQTGCRGTLGNCALALLDLERYGDAIVVLEEVRQAEVRENLSADLTLVELGIARWCAGDKANALRDWEASLGTDYADSAGGVQGPAVLWFGALKTGERHLEEKALKLLKKFWKPRIMQASKWPGPIAIAGFILGDVDERRFVQLWTQDQPILEARRKCKALFWSGVKQSDRALARNYFAAAGADRHAVLEPEFYLARWALHEMGPTAQ